MNTDLTVTVTVDDSKWPFVHLVVDGPVTFQGTQTLMTALDRLLDRGDRFALVFETRNARGIQVPHIRQWANFIESRRQALTDRVHAVAFVLPSPMIRGAARVLFKWARPPFEHRLVDTPAEALGFLGMISPVAPPSIPHPWPSQVG